MSIEGFVKQTISNGVSTIEFFHPKSNSLPSILLKDLSNQIISAGKDDQVKLILIKSSGSKAFCAGASFDELLSIKTKEEGEAFFSGFANVINAIRKVPKFVVVKVQGKTVGGGVGIACAADYCVATESASVKLSELSIGIGPFVIGPAVKRKIGLSAFSSLTINAQEWKSAQWAKEKGMFAEVLQDQDELNQYVNELVKQLSLYSTIATKEIKELLWEGTSDWDNLLKQMAQKSGRLVLSDETIKALEKFKSK